MVSIPKRSKRAPNTETLDYCVCIPSKGRALQLRKLFTKCQTLNDYNTFIGVEVQELDEYQNVLGVLANKVRWVTVDNPRGITSYARQQIKVAATQYQKCDYYVLTDDNCIFDDQSLRRLLRAQANLEEPSVMSGAHPTAVHFHADAIKATSVETSTGDTIYRQVGMIFWSIPGDLYRKFKYPDDCYFDDVYLIFWLLTQGFTNFWACLDAPFNKHRHEAGGTGTVPERVRKMGLGFMRLAQDFPQWMTPSILRTAVPYTKLLEAVKAGKTSL